MKKVFMMFMVLVLALSFIGCAEEDNVPTLEDFMALSTGIDAFDDAAEIAIDDSAYTNAYIDYSEATFSVTGNYTNSDGEEFGDEKYSLTTSLNAYQHDDGGDIYSVTGTLVMSQDHITESVASFVGDFAYNSYTVSVNIAMNTTDYDPDFTGTYTVNGTVFPASSILDFIGDKSASKFAQKFLKK